MRAFIIIITAVFMGLAAYSILQSLAVVDKKTAWVMFAVFCVAVMCALGATILGTWICR